MDISKLSRKEIMMLACLETQDGRAALIASSEAWAASKDYSTWTCDDEKYRALFPEAYERQLKMCAERWPNLPLLADWEHINAFNAAAVRSE